SPEGIIRPGWSSERSVSVSLPASFVLQILEFDGPAHDLDYVMACVEGTQAQWHEATQQRGGGVTARRRGAHVRWRLDGVVCWTFT
ncbi:unnamed protein product, partial [Urochloa humidicola]